MPNIKSSIRSVKTDAERRARNFPIRTSVRSAARRLVEQVESGNAEEAKALLVNASSVIDKAARKGVIHKNAAARKKSRLAKQINKLAQ